MAAFEELGVQPELIRAIEDLEWLLPSPVQTEAIPLVLTGSDVLAAAETGSGKTGAFGLPVLQIAHETLRSKAVRSTPTQSSSKTALALSVDDRDPILAIASDGVTCQCRNERAWAGVRATAGVNKGKFYFEASVEDEGLCRLGWATAASTLELGKDRNGFGYGGTAKKSSGGQFDDYGEKYGLHDTIGCYIDFSEGSVSYSKNGYSLGKAFDIPQNLRNQTFFPAICMKNAQLQANFGSTPFKHPPSKESGFKGLAQAGEGELQSASAVGQGVQSSGGRGPICLVLEPTRELAEQVYNEITKFKKYLISPTIEVGLAVGGMDVGPMMRMFKEGVDVLIATPGRLIDFVESGKVSLSGLRFFVLDEADRLVDQGNLPMISKMFQRAPKTDLQVLLFSATLHSNDIISFAESVTKNAIWVDLKGKDAVPECVHHAVINVDPSNPPQVKTTEGRVPTDGVHSQDSNSGREGTSEALKKIKPRVLVDLIDRFDMQQCMIFCRTQVDCDNLETFLVDLGGGQRFRGKAEKGVENRYSCVVLHGGRPQHERRGNLEAFKDGDVRFLICTDVAARGIDIKELPYVVNMTLPDKSEDYIHRIGRVGRADTMGLAVSIVAKVPEKVWYHSNCKSKGKGKNGGNCHNTNLVEKGGCCIWYDEPECRAAIEKRLGDGAKLQTLEELGITSAEHVQKYGQGKSNAHAQLTAKHVEMLRPTVQKLAAMEVQLQLSYHSFKNDYGKRERNR